MLTKQPKILEIVKEFKIPFLECSLREKISQSDTWVKKTWEQDMLKKGAIQEIEHQTGEF